FRRPPPRGASGTTKWKVIVLVIVIVIVLSLLSYHYHCSSLSLPSEKLLEPCDCAPDDAIAQSCAERTLAELLAGKKCEAGGRRELRATHRIRETGEAVAG